MFDDLSELILRTEQRLKEWDCSAQHLQSVILDNLDTESPKFLRFVDKIQEYMDKPYDYSSKNKRMDHLFRTKLGANTIALKVLTAAITVQEVIPIQGICTRLGHELKFEDKIEGVKTAAELLAVSEAPYFDLYLHNHWENKTGTLGVKTNTRLPEDVIDFMMRVQYPPPMKCIPDAWTNNINGGQLTFNQSVILGGINHHDGHQALDVVNILQETPYVLNDYILSLNEAPKKALVTREQKESFKLMRDSSNKVYAEYRTREFHFVYRMDKRGRLYCQGYHCNPQGAQYKKALIDFADTQVVTR